MSSIAPLVSREVAAKLAEKGIEILVAPVSGGEPKAIGGTLSVMVGGRKEVFEKCYPIFSQLNDLFITGPTRTNVMDVICLLVGRSDSGASRRGPPG